MKKCIFFLLIFLWCQLLFGVSVSYASQIEDYNFSEIEKVLKKNEIEIDFKDVIENLKNGELTFFSSIYSYLTCGIRNEINNNVAVIKQLIGLAITAGLLGILSGIFKNNQISETGFYIIYILISISVTAGFNLCCGIAENMINTLLDFMKILLPTYFLAVSCSGSYSSAVVFYEITIVVIGIMEWLFFKVLMPMIKIYVIINIVDCMAKERVLEKMSELIKKIIKYLMKISICAVTGVNILEGMILPSVDSQAVSTVNKATSVIPGVSGLNSLSSIAVGAGMLIKNTIGGAALIVIVIIALIPATKTGITSLVYQMLAGVLEPITDKRIVNCISFVGQGMELIMKVVVTSAILFIITIAIICLSTNSTFYGISG